MTADLQALIGRPATPARTVLAGILTAALSATGWSPQRDDLDQVVRPWVASLGSRVVGPPADESCCFLWAFGVGLGESAADLDGLLSGFDAALGALGTLAGSTADAPARVVFSYGERCMPTDTFACAPEDRTVEHGSHWPDLPLDQVCTSSTSCPDVQSQVFFDRFRMTSVTTQIRLNGVTQLLPLIDTLPAIRGVVGRPRRKPRILYADRGYDYDKYRRELRARGIMPKIARRGVDQAYGGPSF